MPTRLGNHTVHLPHAGQKRTRKDDSDAIELTGHMSMDEDDDKASNRFAKRPRRDHVSADPALPSRSHSHQVIPFRPSPHAHPVAVHKPSPPAPAAQTTRQLLADMRRTARAYGAGLERGREGLWRQWDADRELQADVLAPDLEALAERMWAAQDELHALEEAAEKITV